MFERIGFREYVRRRKYHYGRGNASSWHFIAVARGDPEFPDAASWPELREYLETRDLPPDLMAAARVVWRSYLRNAPGKVGLLSARAMDVYSSHAAAN